MPRKTKLRTVLVVILAIPLIMWLVWLCTPKTKMVAAIIDKTVLTTQGQEHISLTWILNHQKITKTSTKPYKIANDYYGFFPLDNEKFRLKGLERFSADQLQQLSEDADMVYFTDTYGIYKNEWYAQANNTERSGMIYGGMSSQDIELLKLMKAKRKLIITEFNSIGSPTHVDTRHRFESLFAMRWTGWTGRFFENLDSAKNKELPRWLIRNYKRDNNNQWPFKKSGVAFVNDHDQVVILEDSTDLKDPMPHITSTAYGQENFGLPARIKYAFWFDVIQPDLKTNTQVASFNIDVNARGRKLLAKHNLPAVFPAVIMHKDRDYRFYYFSGDFCDNPISMGTSYFKGITFFKWLFYNTADPMERSSFFWNFYKPMVTKILDEEKEFKGK
ncbi:hypothetical protein [Pedobacter frigoris]|uniref:hypothetical protein n=1 Tax=Pedobacter frigoris TaxID=2571272 RepID=UPI0029313E85|nr:hypothetical protein [Pedobacter frigoris]